MLVFVTGATGFIGTAVVRDLLAAGHQVLGLARSDAAAKSLEAEGAKVHRGSLEDLESLRRGVSASDGVIHTAFVHDFSNYAASAATDERAILTLGSALAASDRPLVATSGTLFLQRQGPLATEEDVAIPHFPRKSEPAALAFVSERVRVSSLRLPPSVHGDGDDGLVPALIELAREKGISAYLGEGQNRWPAVHRLDAASLFRLALEKGSAGARYHGVDDEGVPFREIAEVVGRRLNLPVASISPGEAANHFGWLANFVAVDCPASSAQTQQQLGWRPTHPRLIPDIDRPGYFAIARAAH